MRAVKPFLAVLWLLSAVVGAEVPKTENGAEVIEIGIDDSFLGKQIPMDLVFKDEQGEAISLEQASRGKPFLLALVYYNCTSICSPFLNGIADMVRISPARLQPGQEYTIITVSFDPSEGPEMARGKKESYLNMLEDKRPSDPEAWRFLTGDAETIRRLTESVGFKYAEDGKEFKHASALIAISPSGTIARYMRGLSFLPLDVMMAVLDASQNKWAPTIKKVVKFCFKEDPQGRGYYFNFLNVIGSFVLLALGAFLVALLYLNKKYPLRQKKEQTA